MNRFGVRRPSAALVVSILALVFAMAGGATAATLITGKQIKNSSITGADVKNKSLTARDFRGSVTGSAGPAGAAGPQGAQGPKGDQGVPGADGEDATALWALVDAGAATATLVRGSGVTSVERLSAGFHRVTFDRNVAQCVSLVSLSSSTTGSVTVQGETSTNNSLDNPNAMLVNTRDSAGALADSKDFTLAVFC
jgi:hypothetical protein